MRKCSEIGERLIQSAKEAVTMTKLMKENEFLKKEIERLYKQQKDMTKTIISLQEEIELKEELMNYMG